MIDKLDTEIESGSLMGIYAKSIEELWITSAKENRVYRIEPL
jgi:hypothetical protein